MLTIHENHLRKLYKIWLLPRKIQILLVWCGSFSWVFFKAPEQFSCTAKAKKPPHDPDDQFGEFQSLSLKKLCSKHRGKENRCHTIVKHPPQAMWYSSDSMVHLLLTAITHGRYCLHFRSEKSEDQEF